MNEQQGMIADMAGGLFADLGPAATLERDWSAVEELGLSSLLIGEDHGGFGGDWADALIVFRLAGYHAVALPIVEATIAASLAGGARDGWGTIGASSDGAIVDGRFTGTVAGVPWGDGSSYVVAPAPDGAPNGGAMLLSTRGLTPQSTPSTPSIAGEPRAVFHFDATEATAIDADVFALGALARSAQIAGALDAALSRSVTYSNERQQFGRPLAKFQAVQQSLATFACEAAAANCAALGAAQAQARGTGRYAVAAAKLRTNRAVGVGTALAHQVHGAIGFTEEYPLHPLTRRLWAWRSEFGGDAYWSAVLGDIVCSRGADSVWADLTSLTN